MDSVGAPKTSVNFHQPARRNIPGDRHFRPEPEISPQHPDLGSSIRHCGVDDRRARALLLQRSDWLGAKDLFLATSITGPLHSRNVRSVSNCRIWQPPPFLVQLRLWTTTRETARQCDHSSELLNGSQKSPWQPTTIHHNSLVIIRIPSHLNLVRALIPYLYNIHFNIIPSWLKPVSFLIYPCSQHAFQYTFWCRTNSLKSVIKFLFKNQS